jgi:hypothetical protein
MINLEVVEDSAEQERILREYIRDECRHPTLSALDIIHRYGTDILPAFIRQVPGATKPHHILLSTISYSMTVSGGDANSIKLIDDFESLLENYLLQYTLPVLFEPGSHELFLRKLSIEWERFDLFARYLAYISMHAKVSNDKGNLIHKAITLFSTNIFSQLKDRIFEAFMDAIKRTRNDEITDLDSLQSCTKIYEAIGTIEINKKPSRLILSPNDLFSLTFYEENFETSFLSVSF